MSSEADILQDLQAPIKSFRLFAIEELMRTAKTPAALEALQKQEAVETDEECRLLIGHAIVSLKRRLDSSPSRAGWKITVTDFFEQWGKADSASRLDLLSRVPGNALSEMADRMPALFATETSAPVRGALLSTFTRHWPQAELPTLLSHLHASSLSMRLSVLETLIRRAPDLLKEALPSLLLSDDPRIRGLAVRGLAAIDLDEALAHLDRLLLDPDRKTKLGAIPSLFLLPFEAVKPILYRFLALENDLTLIERVGQLFMVNPDPEVPYKLFEIAETSGSEKGGVIRKILQGATKVIQDSGILREDFQGYIARLQDWINQRAAVRYVQGVIARLTEADAATLPALEVAFKKNLAREPVRKAVSLAQNWSISESSKKILHQWLEEFLREPGNALPASPSPVSASTIPVASPVPTHDQPQQSGERADTKCPPPDVFTLPPQERLRAVALIQPADKDWAIPCIHRIVSDPKATSDLLATSFRAAARIGQTGLQAFAEAALKSTDVPLLTAAMEYLGEQDPDKLFPLLGRFFQNPNARVKSTALRILKKFDPAQAISMLGTMLHSKDVQMQEMAMVCMIHFDFALVRRLLADYLAAGPSPEQFKSGLGFFQANPDLENLFTLYRLEKLVSTERTSLVRSSRASNEALLLDLGLLDRTAIARQEAGFEQRWLQEKARKQEAPAPYSVQALHGAKKPTVVEVMTSLRENVSLTVRFAFLAIVIGGTILLWLAAPAPPDPAAKKARGAALLAEPLDINGLTQGVRKVSGELEVKIDDGTRFLVIPNRNEFLNIGSGIRVRLTIIPIRSTPEGVIICQYSALEMP